jgi:hypothetical protein
MFEIHNIISFIDLFSEEVIEREGDKLLLEELIKGDYEPYVLEPRWSRGKIIIC